MNDNLDPYEGDDPWLIAETEEDGMPMIYRVRQNIPANLEISDYSHLVCVLWEYETTIANGLPGSEVAEQQEAFEDALDDFIEKDLDNEHMVIVTGNGRKEWLWYVKDPDDWIEGFSAALSGHPPFPVEIQGYDAEGWKAYNDLKQALTQSGEETS